MSVPWLVISPHFDDAVFSCGHLLALNRGSVVLTICGGIAEPGVDVSDWDRLCGFTTAEQATQERRREDAMALGVLAATQATTDLLDAAYREVKAEDEDKADEDIRRVMDEVRPERVAVPVGTHNHVDNMLARRAGLRAVLSQHDLDAFLYADLPYFADGEGADALAKMASAEPEAPIPISDEAVERKAAALSHYRSQLQLLAKGFGPRFGAVFLPGVERLYRLQSEPRDVV